MFESITIKYNPQEHTLGQIAEALVFYDDVYLILGIQATEEILRNIDVEILKVLCSFGLHLCISTNEVTYLPIPGRGETPAMVHLKNGDLRRRTVERALLQKEHLEILTDQLQYFVDDIVGTTEPFEYNCQVKDAVIEDVINKHLHKTIIQHELEEIDSEYSLLDKHAKYEFRQLENGNLAFLGTSLSTGELEEQSRAKGSFVFRHENLLREMAHVYALMDFSAERNSTLLTSQVQSIIMSCKAKDMLRTLQVEQDAISSFENAFVIPGTNVADVINSGQKNFGDLVLLLRKAEDFKNWKKDVDDPSKFVTEYQQALSASLPWVKTNRGRVLRLILSSVLGIINTYAGIAYSAMDTFLIDKIQAGAWQPSQFVNGPLKKFVQK